MPSRGTRRGFTLLELLVVLFIIGIIAAMATLSVGVATSAKGVEKEIDRVSDLIALASEEAVLQGREFGVTFYSLEYEFSLYDPVTADWTPLGEEDPGPFAPRRFPPGAVVDLQIDGRLVALAENKPERKPRDADQEDNASAGRTRAAGALGLGAPQIFIFSSGDVTPFALRVRPSIGSPGITLQVADSGSAEKIRDER